MTITIDLTKAAKTTFFAVVFLGQHPGLRSGVC